MIHQQELLEDILSRVPAKSIGRFRCVSKSWKTLLSQPYFIKTHLNRIKQSPFEVQSLILANYRTDSLFTTHLNSAHHMFDEITAVATALCFDNEDHKFNAESIIVAQVASCDGLALFVDKEKRLLLVNPTTKEFKELPKLPFALDPDFWIFTMFGVGYDSVSDDYKVVMILFYANDIDVYAHRTDDASDVFVNVYSVKNGSWKRAANSPYNHAAGQLPSGVFVDGHIHWIATRTLDNSSVIVGFDLGEKRFREVPPPSLVEGSDFLFHSLLTLGGNLSMFVTTTLDPQTNVWVMKEYGVKESWTKLTIVHIQEDSTFRPLCLLGEEQVALVKDEYSGEEKLVVYSLKDESFKDVVFQGNVDDFGVAGTFVKTLVSPHCSAEATREE